MRAHATPSLQEIVAQYQALLETVDAWFFRSQLAFPSDVRCARGCAACCRGLFDITLLDGFLLQEGVRRLPLAQQQAIEAKARQRLQQLQRLWPELQPPYLLNHLPDALWTEMPEDDPTPCPLLGVDGSCLIYMHRPMICRTHGLPNIDNSGESFSDLYCSRNFTDGNPPPREELRWSFRQVYAAEFDLLARFNERVLGLPLREADTFIPLALLIDFSALEMAADR